MNRRLSEGSFASARATLFAIAAMLAVALPLGVATAGEKNNEQGSGHAKVRGVFDVETFSVSQAGSPTVSFPPTHQYHLGLWFDDPQVPFDLGCEPGRTTPSITPFNGDQHAGTQVLNTGNFPDNAGPLSQIHR